MFKKAVKEQAKLRLAIAGPSGSGKTYTALAIATAMGEKVALVDTEHGSASKYADIFPFDVLNLEPPYHPRRFVEAIDAAGEAGYDVLIIDSLSHAWNGPGGVLEIVDMAARKFKGNTYAGWQEGTPAHNMLIEGIVSASIHIIGTMRSKQEYILVEKGGKNIPQKVGMAPVQRDGFEYEFDVYLDMDIENNAIVGKTRCPALTGQVLPKPGTDLAGTLLEWLDGAPPSERPKRKPPAQAGIQKKPPVYTADEMGAIEDEEGNIIEGNIIGPDDEMVAEAVQHLKDNPVKAQKEPTFAKGQRVIVKGNNDEKPGEIVDHVNGNKYRVKVAGKTLTLGEDKLDAIPNQEPLFDEPATDYAE